MTKFFVFYTIVQNNKLEMKSSNSLHVMEFYSHINTFKAPRACGVQFIKYIEIYPCIHTKIINIHVKCILFNTCIC